MLIKKKNDSDFSTDAEHGTHTNEVSWEYINFIIRF